MIIRIKQLLVLCLFISLSANATEFLKQKKAYINLKKETIEVVIENDSVKIIKHFYLEKVANTDDAEGYLSHDIHFSPTWQEIKNLKTTVLTPKGKKYKSTPFDNAEIKSNFSTSIFFDDSRYIKITPPKMYTGQKVIIEYDEIIKDPKFLDPFIISSYMPIKESYYTVTRDPTIELGFSFFHTTDTIPTITEGQEGIQTIEWKFENVAPYKVSEGAPNIRYYEPHMVPYISSYSVNDDRYKVLGNTDDLFSWYAELTNSVNKELSEELKTIADSISSQHNTSLEKAKAIFYWVQDNVRYIAFEDGMGGFIPREASLVCSRRFGDCKDMSSITTAMLTHIGLNAHLTWVGSRDIPYSYNQVHTLTADNHMIASVDINDETIFLDATSSYGKFGDPSGFTQGKQALIRLSDNDYELKYIPVVSAKNNLSRDESRLKINLSTNSLEGQATATHHGLNKFNVSWGLRGKTESELLKLLNGRYSKGSNRFLIDDFSILNLNDRDTPLEVNYSFSIANYVRKIGDQLFVNLNLNKALIANKLQLEERNNAPYEFDYKYEKIFSHELEIPEGYEISFLPESASFQHDSFNFESTYSQNGNVISYKLIITQNQLLMTPDHFVQWNEMVDALTAQYTNNIILKKI